MSSHLIIRIWTQVYMVTTTSPFPLFQLSQSEGAVGEMRLFWGNMSPGEPLRGPLWISRYLRWKGWHHKPGMSQFGSVHVVHALRCDSIPCAPGSWADPLQAVGITQYQSACVLARSPGVSGKARCTARCWTTLEYIGMRKMSREWESLNLSCIMWRLHSLSLHTLLTRAGAGWGVPSWLPCARRSLTHLILPTFAPDLQSLHGLWFLFMTSSWLQSCLCTWEIPSRAMRFSSEMVFLMIIDLQLPLLCCPSTGVFPPLLWWRLSPCYIDLSSLLDRKPPEDSVCYLPSTQHSVWHITVLVGKPPWRLIHLLVLVGDAILHPHTTLLTHGTSWGLYLCAPSVGHSIRKTRPTSIYEPIINAWQMSDT